MLASNKSFARAFNFQPCYCFSVDVDAFQREAVRDWNNTHCFNGCVSGLPGPLASVSRTKIINTLNMCLATAQLTLFLEADCYLKVKPL